MTSERGGAMSERGRVTTLRFNEPATYWQRWPLRLIGVGVILLSTDVLVSLVRYFGVYWHVGAWALFQRPVTTTEVSDDE